MHGATKKNYSVNSDYAFSCTEMTFRTKLPESHRTQHIKSNEREVKCELKERYSYSSCAVFTCLTDLDDRRPDRINM
jgi:hypothetical protein